MLLREIDRALRGRAVGQAVERRTAGRLFGAVGSDATGNQGWCAGDSGGVEWLFDGDIFERPRRAEPIRDGNGQLVVGAGSVAAGGSSVVEEREGMASEAAFGRAPAAVQSHVLRSALLASAVHVRRSGGCIRSDGDSGGPRLAG